MARLRLAGTWELFSDLYVRTGEVEPGVYQAARTLQQSREGIDYEALDVSEDRARSLLEDAQAFVDAVAAAIGD